jgi:hypothetical protein
MMTWLPITLCVCIAGIAVYLFIRGAGILNGDDND